MTSAVTRVRVIRMWETCERTTFFVELTNADGETITPTSHRTGSVYTNFEGLSADEARDRALMEADTWAAFLGLEAEPYREEGVTHVASMTLHHYGERRRRSSGKPDNFAVGDSTVRFWNGQSEL